MEPLRDEPVPGHPGDRIDRAGIQIVASLSQGTGKAFPFGGEITIIAGQEAHTGPFGWKP